MYRMSEKGLHHTFDKNLIVHMRTIHLAWVTH
jgi:hypothetical protein